MIYVWNKYKTVPDDAVSIDTTSGSGEWKELSPFLLGPVELYNGYVAQNVENAWQFAKVYPGFADVDRTPNLAYWQWAEDGWMDTVAHRYPMGKGVVPNFSWWNGLCLGYIEARAVIYAPLYARAVRITKTYRKLKELHLSLTKQGKDLYLRDYDAYDHRSLGMDYIDVLRLPTKKMGHAFVLAMMLENKQVWTMKGAV